MGTVLLYDNTADNGGAMMLHGPSKLILKSSLSLHFVQNRANQMGGAIYYQYSVSPCQSSVTNGYHDNECFIPFISSLKNISLIFDNNSASKVGSVLYGGKLGSCDFTNNNYYISRNSDTYFTTCKIIVDNDYGNHTNFLETFKYVSDISTQHPNSTLSSDANGIEFCSHQPINSSYNGRYYHLGKVYPGMTFNVSLAAFGAANFSISTRIANRIPDYLTSPVTEKFELKQVDPHLWISTSCKNVSYRVLAANITNPETVSFNLYHDNPCGKLVASVTLEIDVKPCPLGFQLLSEIKKCVCDKTLQTFTKECYIDNLLIEREKNSFWISKQANDSGLILHKGGCPFDFCKDESVNVSLSCPEEQCDFNRNGTLCGQCKGNYSLALGTLHCLKCANSNFIALIVPFGLAGIVLVIVIILLHLTVDVGTLNGLIFYVNIVHSNRQNFLSYARETNFYSVFIAWLNLDFGIESCLYDGMDVYNYSWLQFLFPFYIWFLIGAIIIISRYSTRVSKSLGQNPVAALATLLFVSYGKILNAIITPLSLTDLTSAPNDRPFSTSYVWLYNGELKYFKDPKHIILGLFAILTLLLIFLPYTFILLCGHWLMAYSNKCFLSWLNKIKPFMDVYYAPFKQEARYWIGLTLLSRLALLLTISINSVGSNSVNILVIASVTAGLLFIKGRVYENKYNDFLESSFIFNLCIFSIATFYIKEKSSKSQYAVSSASVLISFVIFIGILCFHIYLQLKSTNIWQGYIASSVSNSRLLCKLFPTRDTENLVLNSNDFGAVTSTIVELREPLLDNDDV